MESVLVFLHHAQLRNGFEIRGKSAANAESLGVSQNSCNREHMVDLNHPVPHHLRLVYFLTFRVQSEDHVRSEAFVSSPQNVNEVRILDLQQENVEQGLHRLFPLIHYIS